MKLKNISKGLFAVLSAVILFTGCSKEEAPKEPLSPKQAKETLKSSMNSFYDCLKKAESGSFADFFYYTNFVVADIERKDYYWDSYNPETGTYEKELSHTMYIKKSWFTILTEKFSDQYDQEVDGSDISVFNGTYTWNIESKEWEKEANSSQIVLKFPAKKDDTTNNASLVLKNFSVEEVSYKDGIKKLPKTGELTITVNNEKVFGVKIENVSFHNGTNFSMPLSAKVTIFTSPFTTTINWNRKTSEIFTLDYSFKSPEGCSTSIQTEVTLNHSEYENLTEFKKDVKNISLKVSHNSLNIKGNIDISGLNELNKNEYTATELNTYGKVEVFDNGRKVADLEVDKDSEDNLIFVFVFSDGSKEKAENYVSDIEERIENIFKRFKDSEVNE